MADETDDLEYSETNVSSAQTQGVRKNISLKLKGKGRGKGKSRVGKTRRSSTKKVASDAADEDGLVGALPDKTNTDNEKQFSDPSLEEVILKLETPAFSPIDRAFPEPLHQNKKLLWDHKVNLIADKVIDPLIHCCEKCDFPILNYGRMIPCKHIFCYDCAKKCETKCGKCDENVQRLEQVTVGNVFMCTYGGSRHAQGSCRRTYLSPRDLQAHVNHRHNKPVSAIMNSEPVPTSHAVSTSTSSAHMAMGRDPRDPRAHLQVDVSHHHLQDHRDAVDHARNPNIPLGSPRAYPHSPANYQTPIPVSSARPNLITVTIQDDGAGHSTAAVPHIHPAHTPQYTTPPAPQHQPMTLQHPPANYAPHAYPAPSYSQAPPMTSQTFGQPPPVHHQPPIHPPSGQLYSTPPPVHHPPPATYTPPHAPPQHGPRPIPPQRFPPPTGGYDEGSAYMQQWTSNAVPPPPTRTALPPRPITAPPPGNPVPHIPPRAPAEGGYGPPYYQ